VVREGETLALLAERYGLRVETLLAANELPNADVLAVGQELLVPATDGVLHRVVEGDTLRKIAERYGVDVAAILASNTLGPDPAMLAVGTRVFVPGARVTLSAISPLQPSALEKLTAPSAPGPRRVSDEPTPAVTAPYVAVLDAASGQMLHEHRAHERVAPASVTKIATTIVALERGNPDQVVPVTISGSAMAARDGSSIMGLEPGERVTLRTLLYGMMLPSGNDAAEQVALALAGSRERYVGWMNELVQALGLKDTRFVNPSGMDARGHYSSPYDMAVLARYGMNSEGFRRLSAAATYRGDGYALANLNRLIGTYPGADGVKIGRTPAAGRTIVASATRNGRQVLVSLMRSQDLPGDSAALFDWVWRTYAWDQ
jgi:D-alanyl-D-alanine carboxypeptidase